MPDAPLPRLEGDAQSNAAWHRARRRAVALEAILAAEGPRSAAVAAAARELALSTRQVYALLRRYELARTLGSLLRRTGARGSRITPAVEQIIRAWLKRYLRRERKSLRAIVNCIRDDASVAGERPPGINTVRRCLRQWYTDEEIVKRRHGPRGHANRLHPRAGTIRAAIRDLAGPAPLPDLCSGRAKAPGRVGAADRQHPDEPCPHPRMATCL